MKEKPNGGCRRILLRLLLLVLVGCLALPVHVAAEEPAVDGFAAEESVAEEPIEEDPIEEDPIEEDPIEEDPIEEDPIEEDPIEEDPIEDEPVGQQPVAGASEEADSSDEEGEEAGEGESEEDKPTGEAYLVGQTEEDGWTHFENNETGNAIQQALDAAIKAGQQSITIVVQSGTYSGGINLDNSGDGKASIAVNIVSHDSYAKPEDAGEDTADSVYPIPVNTDGTLAVGAEGSGDVKVEDGVNVKNVNLLLAGIYLSLKQQKEDKGKIESALTEETGTSQDIKVEGADSFTYYGTAEGDTVNFELKDVDTSSIDSGDGDDSIKLSIANTPEAKLDETSETTGSSEVTVSSGEGNDVITVTHQNNVSEKDDTYYIYNGATELKVDAGAGADTITLKGKTNLIDAAEENQSKKIHLTASEHLKDAVGVTATVLGGSGDDLLNLDTNWELASFAKTTVSYDGGSGNDRLHLSGGIQKGVVNNVTGEVDANGDGSIHMLTANKLSKTEYSIVDKNLWFNETVTEYTLPGVQPLLIQLLSVDALTDDLSGKDTVDVEISDGKVMADGKEVEFRAFTDYVADIGSFDTIGDLSNTTAGGLLTNLILKGQHLLVGEDDVINLPGVTLVLEAEDGSYDSGSITVNGKITAGSIILKLTNSDSHAITFVEKDGEDMVSSDPSIMDVTSDVRVVIANTAKLIATKVVDIIAQSVQTKGLLPNLTDLVPGFGNLEESKINEYLKKLFGYEGIDEMKEAASINFVSVKMANAIIEILGTIQAGSVRMSAVSKIETTASNSVLRDLGLPLAIGVVMGEAGIVVNGGSITAKDDIHLNAESTIDVTTEAKSGRLPFTLAVSVVDNKAYVDIAGGTLRTTDGDIIANATGTVKLNTISTGTNEAPNNNAVVPSTDNEASKTATMLDKGKSGGFFAISVVNQDVFAALRGDASAVAAGNLKLASNANVSVVNSATSNPQEDGESMTLAEMIKTLAGGGEEEDGEIGGIVGKVLKFAKKIWKTPEPPVDANMSEEEKAAAEKQEAKQKAEEKKNNVIVSFIDKLTGNSDDGEGDDVTSLVDKATSSANSGNTDSTHTVQLVGALAITYANNKNKAYIDTQGTVQAGADLSVLANGEMHVETVADGSPVEREDPGAEDEKGENDGSQDQHFPAHNHGVVKVEKLTNGTILIDTENPESGRSVEFRVKAVFGHKLAKDEKGYYIINTVTNTKTDKKEERKIYVTFDKVDENGNTWYTGKISGLDVAKANTVKAEFVTKDHSITPDVNLPQLGTVEITDRRTDGKKMYHADLGELVYVKVNVKSGATFVAPYITYLAKDSTTPQPVTVTEPLKVVQEDGTVDYYYGFEMPEGNVTVGVQFTGEKMDIDVEDVRGADVWITPSDAETTGEATTKYAGNVGDRIKIVIQLANATYLVENSLMFAGKTPVYIKDITYDGENQYTCYVNIPAILKTEGSSTAGNALKLTFQTTTNQKEAQQTIENKGTALGAGLAVDVTRYNNEAYIINAKDNTVTAEGIEVRANTAAMTASAISKAGFVAADLGVAGAITVHLVSANSEAQIGGNISQITLSGGNLVVDATINSSNVVTNANAAGGGGSGADADPDSTGVGAGIAVGVTNLAVVSRILDTVTITGEIGELEINAGHSGTESMSASAGAAGGTSAVPVLALNISGVRVLADSGYQQLNELLVSGGAKISAANTMVRTITADAAAAGHGVGVGASFIIDVLRDSASAKLGRAVRAGGDIVVTADSASRLTATAKSGAQGSVSEDGGSECSGGTDGDGQPSEEPPPSGDTSSSAQLPDDYYGGLDDLFGDNPVEPEEEEDPESLAPLFREGEADKFVDSNKQSAQDLSAMVSNGNGNIDAASVGNAFENRQKAETSEGSVQVAATMVLNIQSNEVLAEIADVKYAVAGGNIEVTSRHDTDAEISADASATNSTTGVGVGVAINTVSYTNIAVVRTDAIRAASVTIRAGIYEEETKETAEEVSDNLIKAIIADLKSLESFIDDVLEAAKQKKLRAFISEHLAEYAADTAQELTEEDENVIAGMIMQWVSELLQGKTPSYPTATQENAVKEVVVKYCKDIFNELKKNFSLKNLVNLTVGNDGLWGAAKKGLSAVKDVSVKQKAMDAAFSYLAGKLGGNEEAESIGPRISTSAISGAGASDVGVAGSVAISVVNGESYAYLVSANGGALFVDGDIIIESKAAQDVYTSAGSSVDALGRVDKNKATTDTANSTQGGDMASDSSKSVGVGAAVAMSFADLISEAGIGSGWLIEAANQTLNSHAENNVETVSVSGTDPLARTEEPSDEEEKDPSEMTEEEKKQYEEEQKKEEEEKVAKAMDYAVDASVAVTLIQNRVRTYLDTLSVLELSGDLSMTSGQSGTTATNASGFAMGNDTAVGAAVAINLAFSDVLTQFLANGTVKGNAFLDAATENQDDANAMALAMGAEIDRYFGKIRDAEKVKAFNKKAEKENKEKVNNENDTSKTIANRLNRASAVKDDENSKTADASMPLSVQALKSQDVKTESTNQTDPGKNGDVSSTVGNATNSGTGDAVNGALNNQAQEGQSIHVAAAVGLNVTAHNAKTVIGGKLTSGGLHSVVDNNGNFSTTATGAAISEATNSNCVGVAVAVSVNANKAEVEIPDWITLKVLETPQVPEEDEETVSGEDEDTEGEEEEKLPPTGEIEIRTNLIQNASEGYMTRYGVVAVAGSSSGKGGKVGLAGSVAILVAKGTSAVVLGEHVTLIAPGVIELEATDRSKLSAAAMAATKSDGSTVGVGASFALLYAKNHVLAQAGDSLTVQADSFKMAAVKEKISIEDFEIPTIRDYIKLIEVDEKESNKYDPENADDYGMIVIQRNQNGTYSAFTNLQGSDVTDLIQLTAVLAYVNYYASAVAGTVMERGLDTSNQKTAVAGAVSMLFNESVTGVGIGDNANITTSGETELHASSEANGRLLGGALSSSGAKAGIGLNVATVKQDDQVFVTIGSNVAIQAESFSQIGESVSDLLVITATAVSASGNSVGGGLNVVVNNTGVETSIADSANIAAREDVEISADSKATVILGSMNVSISGAAEQGAAVGAIVSVTNNNSHARAIVGDGASITSAFDGVMIHASNEELVIHVLAAAARSGNGAAGSGTIGVLTTDAKAIAGVGSNANIKAWGDITIQALSKASLIDLMLAASASNSAPAAGATIMVNVFGRETGAYVGDGSKLVSKWGCVLVDAAGEETAVIISVAGSAASGTSVSGNIQVNVGNSKTYATIGNDCGVYAWDSIGVTANQKSTVVSVSPSVSLSTGATSVGATIQTNVLSTDISALIGNNATLVAYAQPSGTNGVETANREQKRKGIILSALSKDMVVVVGVSAASAGGVGATGVVETLVNRVSTAAAMGQNASVTVGAAANETADAVFEGATLSDGEGELTAEADADSTLFVFGGALSASTGNGVGATILTVVFEKAVLAELRLNSARYNLVRGSVNVTAKSLDNVILTAVNFGFSNNSAITGGGSVLTYQNTVAANLSGRLEATGNVSVLANSNSTLINEIASVTGSLAGASVSGAAIVTYFRGLTAATVGAYSDLRCADLIVNANSADDVYSNGIGITASVGSAAVSGITNVIVTQRHILANIEYGAIVNAANVSVTAKDAYKLLAVVATVSGGSSVGASATVVVTVAKNTVQALIGSDCKIYAKQNLTVQAISDRNIANYAGSISGGATAGAGVTVMVAVIGGKLDPDAANGIQKGFKPDAFMANMKSAAPKVAQEYLNHDLSKDLEAEGTKASDLQVGDSNGNYTGTDDYRSEDFNDTYVSGSNPGEDLADGVTNEDGSDLGVDKPATPSENTVAAIIGNDCMLEVGNTLTVEAIETLSVDIVTASGSAGGAAGLNVGVAVVVANSNVLAEIETGTNLTAVKLIVHASSGGQSISDSEQAKKALAAAGIAANTTGNSIRAIAISFGAGATVGAAPAVAVVNMASAAIARMDGVHGNAVSILNKAEMRYPNVLAVTGSIGGGTAGISASVAVVTFNSDTYAGINGSVKSSIRADKIEVLTNVVNTAKAYAATLAAGGVGINGGVAVVTNRSTTRTTIGPGSYETSNASVGITVNAKVDTSAESYIVGVAIGGVAVGLNAAVVNQHANILTNVLLDLESNINTKALTVTNEVTANAKASVMAVTGGAIGVGGNVLLVFNNVDSGASVTIVETGTDHGGTHLNIWKELAVQALMDVNSRAELVASVVGGVAVGLSTSYVGLNVRNFALLETGIYGSYSVNSIFVAAGTEEDPNNFHATASTVAGGAGGVSVGMNAAVADNNTVNEAMIFLAGRENKVGSSITAIANADATAVADVVFINMGEGVTVSSANAIALLRIEQPAAAELADVTALRLTVKSILNRNTSDASGRATLTTGSVGLYNAASNVAVVYGLSNATAKAVLNNAKFSGEINILSIGTANVKSETVDDSAGAFRGSVFVNIAYGRGGFESILKVVGGEINAGSVIVETIQSTNAYAKLIPAASELNLSLVSFNVNLAIAQVASYSLASIEGNGILNVKGNLTVGSDGSNGTAFAEIIGASINASGISFGSNLAESRMMLGQEARIRGVKIHAGGDIKVHSNASGVVSKAETGSNGGIDLKLVGYNLNYANAMISLVNQIFIDSAELTASGRVDIFAYSNNSSAQATAKPVDSSLGGLDAALTSTYACVSIFETSVIVVDSSITGESVEAISESNNFLVIASSSVPRTSASLIGMKNVIATAEISERFTWVVIRRSDLKSTVDDIILRATSHEHLNASSRHPSTDVSAIAVKDYRFNILVEQILTDVMLDGNIDSARNVSVSATDNLTADIIMDDTSIGGFTDNTGVAKILVNNVTAHVDVRGQIDAVKNINILAKAVQMLTADVDPASDSFKEKGYAKTDIILYRNAIIDIDGKLTADNGNIDIHALLDGSPNGNVDNKVIKVDLDVRLDTWIDGSEYPTATGKLVSKALINVASGSVIQAMNLQTTSGGNVNLIAKNAGAVLVDVFRYVDKILGSNACNSICDISETVQIVIGDKDKVQILGYNVDISARSEMDVRSVAEGRINTLTGNNGPSATIIFCSDLDVIIRSADISAKKILSVSAYLPSLYLKAYAFAFKEWLGCYNDPASLVKGNIYADVTMDNNTVIRAQELDVKAFHPADNSSKIYIERCIEWEYSGWFGDDDNKTIYDTTRSETANAYNAEKESEWTEFCKRKKIVQGVYNPKEKDEDRVFYSGKITFGVSSNSGVTTPSGVTEIYLGDGAIGIFVEIGKDGQITVSGLAPHVDVDSLITLVDNVYHIDGSRLEGSSSSGKVNFISDILGSNYMFCESANSANLTVNNRTDKDVQLNKVNQGSNAATTPGAFIHVTQNSADADVIFSGGGNYTNGMIRLELAGGDVILKDGAEIRGNEIYILGTGSLIDQGRSDGKVQITNDSYFADKKYHSNLEIQVEEDLDLLILTRLSEKTVQKLHSNGNIILEVYNPDGHLKYTTLGEILAKGDVTVRTSGKILRSDAYPVNISGNHIHLYAGDAIGTAKTPIFIDSQGSIIAKSETVGVYLNELSGDMYIDTIVSGGTGSVILKTNDGNIFDIQNNRDEIELMNRTMLAALELQALAAVTNDRVRILEEYIQTMIELTAKIQDATEETSADVLNEGRSKIDILHNVTTTDEALTILQENIALRQEEVLHLKAEYDEQINSTYKLILQVREMYKNVQPSGIVSSNDVVLEVNTASGRGSVGTQEQSLGITAKGSIRISGGKGTVLDTVSLESYADMNLHPMVADLIDIHTLGGIKAASGVNSTVLTANRLILHAVMGGDIGSSGNLLKLSANIVNMFGGNIYITNGKDLVVELLLATDEVVMNIQGSLYDCETGSVLQGIYAEQLKLNVSGNVGKVTTTTPDSEKVMLRASSANSANALRLNVEKDVIISARDVCLESARTLYFDSVHANGKLEVTTDGAIHMLDSDSEIYCKGLMLNAFGYVGHPQQPLAVRCEGDNLADSYLYGENILLLPDKIGATYDTVTDDTSGIKVIGSFDDDVILNVDTNVEHNDCIGCQHLLDQYLNEKHTFVRLELEGAYDGPLQVEIPMEHLADGQEVIVLTCRDGVIFAIRAVVRNGYIVFLTEELGAFLVLKPGTELKLSADEKFIISETDGKMLPFGGWLGT